MRSLYFLKLGCRWRLAAAALLISVSLHGQDTDRDGLSDAYERGFGRYELVLGAFSWPQAKLDAEARGGHLATVVSGLEWLDLKAVLGPALHGKNLWLGGTDEGTEGNWRWVTGEEWKYSNWRVNEPGNDSLGNGTGVPENYLMIWGNETASLDNQQALWNDATPTGGVLARDGYILERGYWTDMNDPDTDDDGLADSEEVLGLKPYEVVAGSFTWTRAKADAEARGGHLGVITSVTEWDKVSQTLASSALSSIERLWLGATDAAQEGLWRWVTGEPFNYRRWAVGQPDARSEFDYLLLTVSTGLWSAAPEGVLAAYLLERESVFQTDPNHPDTDRDGLRDGDEAKFYRTDPTKADTDADSLSDFDELRQWRTNPLVGDSDGDGLTDGEEVFTYRTDPIKTDTDGDGFSDRVEVSHGSDPLAASSLPGPTSRGFTAVELEFPTKLGESYQIQVLDSSGKWTNFGAKLPGTGAPITRFMTTRNASKMFWRVVLAQ